MSSAPNDIFCGIARLFLLVVYCLQGLQKLLFYPAFALNPMALFVAVVFIPQMPVFGMAM
jgi:hypothetical protein